MKKIKLLSVIITSLIVITSCNSNKDKTIDELINLYKQNGFKGKKSDKIFAAIGAIDGCGYENSQFSIEIYKFKDLKNMDKGPFGAIPYKNGSFGMIIHQPSESKRKKIIDIFNSFGKGTYKKTEKKEEVETKIIPSINKEFITLNSIQIGDNIDKHKNFILADDQDNFFDIYINKKGTTINKLKGNLKLFVSNSIVEKIEFDSGDSFMGSTSVAGTIFDAMLKERKSWIRDAMLNYNITEWDDSKKLSQYVKQDYLHQYDLERIEMLGVQMGWNMSYIITSKDAEKKELQGKKRNLNFGSTKERKEVKNNINENKEDQKEVEFIQNSKKQKKLTISVDNLRVRTSPGLDSEKIENLAIGSEVEFLEKSSNQTTVTIKNNEITEYWYKVKTASGKIGWIHGCCFDK